MTTQELFLQLLHTVTNAHLSHVQTKSFATHMATGELYEQLPALIDGLIETYQGDQGKVLANYPVKYSRNDSFIDELKDMRETLTDNREVCGDCTEVQNVIDEILALFDKTIYKLTFLK